MKDSKDLKAIVEGDVVFVATHNRPVWWVLGRIAYIFKSLFDNKYDVISYEGDIIISNAVISIDDIAKPVYGIKRKVFYKNENVKKFTKTKYGFITHVDKEKGIVELEVEDRGGLRKKIEVLFKDVGILRENQNEKQKESLLGTVAHLHSIELSSFSIWKSNVIYKPTSSINIILGKNGYAKTQFLRIIAGVLSDQTLLIEDIMSGYAKASFTLQDPIDHEVRKNVKEKVELLAIPDNRFLDKSKNVLELLPYEEHVESFKQIITSQFLRKKPLVRDLENLFAFICNLYILDMAHISNPEVQPNHYGGGAQEVFSLIENVMSTLINVNMNRVDTTQQVFKILRPRSFNKISSVERYELFVQSENEEILPIQTISQGTLSLISVFVSIFWFLKETHPDVSSGEVTKQSGIVIIDEIDAHLHPAWQREIISLLRIHFPKVQFIMTAHSPLVVQGTMANEVSILDKEGDTLVLKQVAGAHVGEGIEHIYSSFFGDIPLKDKLYTEAQSIYEQGDAAILKLKGEIEKADEEQDLETLRQKLQKWEALKLVKADWNNLSIDFLLNTITVLRRENNALLQEVKQLEQELNKMRSDGNKHTAE